MYSRKTIAPVAQLVECIHGKDEVAGSIPAGGCCPGAVYQESDVCSRCFCKEFINNKGKM
jgi:hypothetical protein